MTRRAKLEALREKLEEDGFVGFGGGLNAALIAQYRAVLADLDALPDVVTVSKHDELRARRAGRRSETEAS